MLRLDCSQFTECNLDMSDSIISHSQPAGKDSAGSVCKMAPVFTLKPRLEGQHNRRNMHTSSDVKYRLAVFMVIKYINDTKHMWNGERDRNLFSQEKDEGQLWLESPPGVTGHSVTQEFTQPD